MAEDDRHAPRVPEADPRWPQSLPDAPGEGDVHVFRIALDRDRESLHRLHETLSPDEKARARRLISLRERYRLIAARGALRGILAACLKREPDALYFTEGPRGKPRLPEHYDGGFTRFNMSHSGPLALVAVAGGREMGVDVEHLARRVRHLEVARRFFAQEEAAAIEALPADRRKEAFLAIWTRKEAFLKAEGRGIGVSLKEVEVPTHVPGPESPTLVGAASGEAGPWSLVELDPGEGFVASLVAEGEGFGLRKFTWPG